MKPWPVLLHLEAAVSATWEGTPVRRLGVNGLIVDYAGRNDTDGVFKTFLTVGNDVLQDLMGGGRMGTGYSVIAGPMFLQVASGDDAEARALIAHGNIERLLKLQQRGV